MRFVIAILILFSGTYLPATAQDAAQEKIIEDVISDYFIRNPEKLGEALNNLQAYYQQQERMKAEKALSDNADELFKSPADFTMGPADAPITIVEFFDYNCGYCKRAFTPLMQILNENDDVRLVFKEYPILNQDSRLAAKTALAIDDQLQFLTFHTKLMNHQGSITPTVIDKIISEMKLSSTEIASRLDTDKVNQTLARTNQLAGRLGINGTPAFVINDKLYPGALSLDDFKTAVNTAREDLQIR